MTQIPAQAFGEAQPKDLPLGSVLKFRETWSMVVGYEQEERDLLMFEGELAGQLIKMPDSRRKYAAIMAPFSWFPAVAEGSEPSIVEHRTNTLMLTNSGPAIVGAAVGRYDIDYRAFRLDGLFDPELHCEDPSLRFVDWSAELAHKDTPFKSLGQIFKVNACILEVT